MILFSIGFSAFLNAINPIIDPLENTSAQIDVKNPVELTPDAESDLPITQEQNPQSTPEKTLWSMAVDFELFGIIKSIASRFAEIVTDTISVVKVFFGFDAHNPAVEPKDDAGVSPPPTPEPKTTQPKALPKPENTSTDKLVLCRPKIRKAYKEDDKLIYRGEYILEPRDGGPYGLEDLKIMHFEDLNDKQRMGFFENLWYNLNEDVGKKSSFFKFDPKEYKIAQFNTPIENPPIKANGLLSVAKNPTKGFITQNSAFALVRSLNNNPLVLPITNTANPYANFLEFWKNAPKAEKDLFIDIINKGIKQAEKDFGKDNWEMVSIIGKDAGQTEPIFHVTFYSKDSNKNAGQSPLKRQSPPTVVPHPQVSPIPAPTPIHHAKIHAKSFLQQKKCADNTKFPTKIGQVILDNDDFTATANKHPTNGTDQINITWKNSGTIPSLSPQKLANFLQFGLAAVRKVNAKEIRWEMKLDDRSASIEIFNYYKNGQNFEDRQTSSKGATNITQKINKINKNQSATIEFARTSGGITLVGFFSRNPISNQPDNGHAGPNGIDFIISPLNNLRCIQEAIMTFSPQQLEDYCKVLLDLLNQSGYKKGYGAYLRFNSALEKGAQSQQHMHAHLLTDNKSAFPVLANIQNFLSNPINEQRKIQKTNAFITTGKWQNSNFNLSNNF